MTVCQLYAFLNEKIPSSLSCEWDNDGLMCCPEGEHKAERVLIALDITEQVVKQAIEGEYDVILSHHPLMFHPLKALNDGNHVAKKVISLIQHGICAMSFHTRLDAVAGGVNDTLAHQLGLKNVVPFISDDGHTIGRVGEYEQEMTLQDFAMLVKKELSAPVVQYSCANRPVRRVAVLGGDGKEDVAAARAVGADTYLTGNLRHDQMTDAPECSINLITAGHFHTEHPVCQRLRELVLEADGNIQVTVVNSDPVKTV